MLDKKRSSSGQKKSNIYYIFQNVPAVKDGSRLVIDPGYLLIEGIGLTKNIKVKEYTEKKQKDGTPCIDLIAENPEIISVSDLEITAIQAGTTMLTVEKDGLSDSIQVIVKQQTWKIKPVHLKTVS